MPAVAVLVLLSILGVKFALGEHVDCLRLNCNYCQDPYVAASCPQHCTECTKIEEIWYGNPLIKTVPQVTKARANEVFQSCCDNIGLPYQCQSLCTYDTTFRQLKECKRGGCSTKHLREILICASGGQDVTDCCERYGAFQGTSNVCRMFCRPTDNRWAADFGLNTVYKTCARFIEGYLYCMYLNLPAQ